MWWQFVCMIKLLKIINWIVWAMKRDRARKKKTAQQSNHRMLLLFFFLSRLFVPLPFIKKAFIFFMATTIVFVFPSWIKYSMKFIYQTGFERNKQMYPIVNWIGIWRKWKTNNNNWLRIYCRVNNEYCYIVI